MEDGVRESREGVKNDNALGSHAQACPEGVGGAAECLQCRGDAAQPHRDMDSSVELRCAPGGDVSVRVAEDLYGSADVH